MKPSTLKIGLIGAPGDNSAEWLRLLTEQPRLQCSDVFDPTFARSREWAETLAGAAAPGLRRLFRRVAGAVVAAHNWMGPAPAAMAAQLERPCLIASAVWEQFTDDQLRELVTLAHDTATLLMPELLDRWTPATLRLRELTATRLGAIERLRVESAASEIELAPVIDWCCYVIQSQPLSILAEQGNSRALLRFRRLDRYGDPVTAEIVWGAQTLAENGKPRRLLATAECRHGQIEMPDEHQLAWRSGSRREQEALHADRSPAAVMLDLFGRRLAGGVVPVPDLRDLLRCRIAVAAAHLSRHNGAESPLVETEGR